MGYVYRRTRQETRQRSGRIHWADGAPADQRRVPPRGALTDLALDLGLKSAGFRRSLPGSLLSSLADLVRSMNCYYSNLIEGHDTHPIDIERALKGDYSKD